MLEARTGAGRIQRPTLIGGHLWMQAGRGGALTHNPDTQTDRGRRIPWTGADRNSDLCLRKRRPQTGSDAAGQIDHLPTAHSLCVQPGRQRQGIIASPLVL
jgi:hypothetical protein